MRIRSANTKCNSARVSVLALVKCLVFVTCAFSACTLSAAQGASNPERFFQEGEAALRDGKLTQAEVAFRRVVAVDPQSAGAFSNLGVIAMRQRSWARAIENLEKAERLAPTVAGIRLNIGLAYFKQGDYGRAVAPLKSVVRDQPASLQAQYLLGLCYFFTQRFPEAVQTLMPLWSSESENMNFLYVLAAGAHLAGQNDLEDRALARLVEIGHDTPEFHLLLGKARLNKNDFDAALQEFRHAADANPNLPFVHFNLGLALMNKRDFQAARDEFLKDIAIEPDVASNYDQLGTVYSYLENSAKSEKSFREAIRRDAHVASPHFGLAKVLQDQGKYSQALSELDIAEGLLPGDYHIHFVRGRVLLKLGRKQEAKKESAFATKILSERNTKISDQSQPVPSPEIISEPQ